MNLGEELTLLDEKNKNEACSVKSTTTKTTGTQIGPELASIETSSEHRKCSVYRTMPVSCLVGTIC